MYEINQSSSPFLMKKLQVYRPVFRDDYKKVNLRSNIEKGVEGGAVSLFIQQALKATFGESLERTSLYINSGNFIEDEVFSYDFSRESYNVTSVNRILLCPDSRILKEEEFIFNDTCGVASHTDSFKAIEAGFLEFIERQSLVYNWLTKTKGEKLDERNFYEPKTKSLINRVTNYVDDFYAFNISLLPNIFVILCIGVGEKHFGIGLSADWDAKKAFHGAIDELYQFFGLQKNKYGINLDSKEYMREFTGTFDERDPQYYLKSFIEKFGGFKLLEEYSYLLDSPPKRLSRKLEPKNTKDLTNIIKEVSSDLGIDIQMAFIPSKVKNVPIKIVKFFTELGFPHMNTKLIDIKDILILNGKTTPNKNRLLPFP